MKRNSIVRKAYSLIELSIVLTIVSVLVSGAMTISVAKMKQESVKITEERMKVIYGRMRHYLKVNRALPCPAPITDIKSSSSTYGTLGNCTAVSGVFVNNTNQIWGAVPVLNIGLPAEYAEDGFGSKFIYFIDKRFTTASDTSVPPDFATTTFSTMLNDQLSASPLTLWTIKERVSGSLQTITDKAVLGIVSLGENKGGAYNANAATANAATADTDEQTNDSATTVFISSSASSDSFDDIVFYKTASQMLGDFAELKHLVPCDNTDADYIGSSTGDTWYNGIAYSKKHPECTANPDLRHSKRCGAGGTFTDLYTSNCESAGSDGCSLAIGNIGTGAYSGSAVSMASGDTAALTCRSGYGRQITGTSYQFRSNNTSQTCDRLITDRTNTAPLAVCKSGTITVLNDCSACRSCSSTSGVYSRDRDDVYDNDDDEYFTVLETRSCVASYGGDCGNGNMRFDAYYYTGPNMEFVQLDPHEQAARGCGSLNTQFNVDSHHPLGTHPYDLGVSTAHNGAQKTYCQHQNHDRDSSGALAFKCYDGKYRMRSRCCKRSKNCDNNAYNNWWGTGSCPNLF